MRSTNRCYPKPKPERGPPVETESLVGPPPGFAYSRATAMPKAVSALAMDFKLLRSNWLHADMDASF